MKIDCPAPAVAPPTTPVQPLRSARIPPVRAPLSPAGLEESFGDRVSLAVDDRPCRHLDAAAERTTGEIREKLGDFVAGRPRYECVVRGTDEGEALAHQKAGAGVPKAAIDTF
jgi:hypothetical protein